MTLILSTMYVAEASMDYGGGKYDQVGNVLKHPIPRKQSQIVSIVN